MAVLSKAGMVDSVQGKGGGYRLNRPLSQYRVGDILRETEGSLAPVTCLEENGEPCCRASTCRTLPVWDRLNALVNDYLDGISLADLVEN
jgi:Rrf2 family protein